MRISQLADLGPCLAICRCGHRSPFNARAAAARWDDPTIRQARRAMRCGWCRYHSRPWLAVTMLPRAVPQPPAPSPPPEPSKHERKMSMLLGIALAQSAGRKPWSERLKDMEGKAVEQLADPTRPRRGVRRDLGYHSLGEALADTPWVWFYCQRRPSCGRSAEPTTLAQFAIRFGMDTPWMELRNRLRCKNCGFALTFSRPGPHDAFPVEYLRKAEAT